MAEAGTPIWLPSISPHIWCLPKWVKDEKYNISINISSVTNQSMEHQLLWHTHLFDLKLRIVERFCLKSCFHPDEPSQPLKFLFYPDEPSQPGRPNIIDWGPNHCDLSWRGSSIYKTVHQMCLFPLLNEWPFLTFLFYPVPESDGGSPITHYVLELKVSLDCNTFIHQQQQ